MSARGAGRIATIHSRVSSTTFSTISATISQPKRRAVGVRDHGDAVAGSTDPPEPACGTRAMQLRYMQTLANIAGDRTSTVVFPMPIDLLARLAETAK